MSADNGNTVTPNPEAMKAPVDAASDPPGSPPVPANQAGNDYEPSMDMEKLEYGLYDIWNQALAKVAESPDSDITIVIDYIVFCRRALREGKLDDAQTYYARAQMWCTRLNRKKSTIFGGGAAILVQFVYLGLLLFWATAYYGSALKVLPPYGWLRTTSDFAASTVWSTEAIGIPFYTVAWGFLGGIAWCLYVASYWIGRVLFNSWYLAWYVCLPFVGALLGVATSTVILAGLTSVVLPDVNTSKDLSALPFSVVAALCLVSFISGYSARHIWRLLDRTVRKLLQDQPQSHPEPQLSQSSVESNL